METSLQYVVLRHDGIPHPHFDLMFEWSPGSNLRTWRSDEWPIVRTTKLEALPDHRREYLTYEGPVPRAGGWVKKVASGSFTSAPLKENPFVMDFWLEDGQKFHLRLLAPPQHEWAFEPTDSN
jgi:hypothetical protein